MPKVKTIRCGRNAGRLSAKGGYAFSVYFSLVYLLMGGSSAFG